MVNSNLISFSQLFQQLREMEYALSVYEFAPMPGKEEKFIQQLKDIMYAQFDEKRPSAIFRYPIPKK